MISTYQGNHYIGKRTRTMNKNESNCYKTDWHTTWLTTFFSVSNSAARNTKTCRRSQVIVIYIRRIMYDKNKRDWEYKLVKNLLSVSIPIFWQRQNIICSLMQTRVFRKYWASTMFLWSLEFCYSEPWPSKIVWWMWKECRIVSFIPVIKINRSSEKFHNYLLHFRQSIVSPNSIHPVKNILIDF